MSLSLFHIEKEMQELLEGLGGEIDDENLAITNLTDALMKKTDQVSSYRESLLNYQLLLNSKILELNERYKQVDKKVQSLDGYILNCMAIGERDSFEGSFCKIKKRKPSQAVDIYDEKLIPIDYIKIPEVKPMIMKAEIAKALKAGEVIDGARMIDGKISLTFSVK